MDVTSGEMKEDIALPTEGHLSEVKKLIQSKLEEAKKEVLVTVQKWGEKEQACAVRDGKDDD